MNLVWATSVSAGALHAARALSAGRTLVDRLAGRGHPVPADALALGASAAGRRRAARPEPSGSICCLWPPASRLPAAGLSRPSSWRPRRTRTSGGSPPDLATRVHKPRIEPQVCAVGRRPLGSGLWRGFRSAFVAARPHLAEELPLRASPCLARPVGGARSWSAVQRSSSDKRRLVGSVGHRHSVTPEIGRRGPGPSDLQCGDIRGGIGQPDRPPPRGAAVGMVACAAPSRGLVADQCRGRLRATGERARGLGNGGGGAGRGRRCRTGRG